MKLKTSRVLDEELCGSTEVQFEVLCQSANQVDAYDLRSRHSQRRRLRFILLRSVT